MDAEHTPFLRRNRGTACRACGVLRKPSVATCGFAPAPDALCSRLTSHAPSSAASSEIMMSDVERESMEFDVVIVGAGPAGLSAAIRLKQINPDLSVVVLEKGAEVGAHILSGAVVDPIGIDRLLPDWRDGSRPSLQDAGDRRPFPRARAGRLGAPAQFPDAAADEQPRQLHRVARQCLPLAGRPGRGARRRDLSGLRRRRACSTNEAGAVTGVATGDMGVERDGSHGPAFAPRHGAARQVCADRRRRARLAGQAAHRQVRPGRGPRAAESTASASRNSGRSSRRSTGRASCSIPSAGRST